MRYRICCVRLKTTFNPQNSKIKLAPCNRQMRKKLEVIIRFNFNLQCHKVQFSNRTRPTGRSLWLSTQSTAFSSAWTCTKGSRPRSFLSRTCRTSPSFSSPRSPCPTTTKWNPTRVSALRVNLCKLKLLQILPSTHRYETRWSNLI